MRKFAYCSMLAIFASWALLTSAQEETNEKIEITIPDRTEVLASRGAVEISFSEVDSALKQIPSEMRQQFLQDPERFTKFLNSTLLTKALASRVMSKDQLSQAIESRIYWVVIKELSEIAQERIVEEDALDSYESQAREIYLTNPDRFMESPRATFWQILFTPQANDLKQNGGGATAAPEDIAHHAYEEYHAGQTFDSLVSKYAKNDPTRQTGGKLDDVQLSNLDPEFASALKSMKVGEVAIVESGFGTHLVKLVEFTEAARLPFEEVEQQLRSEARQRHQQKILERTVSNFYNQELELPDGATRRFLERQSVSWE